MNKIVYTTLSPEEKNIVDLKTRVAQLEELVKKIQTDKLIHDLQLPEEVINNIGEEVFPTRKNKLGKAAVPLLESEIREAQEKTMTAAAAARYLNVCYITYKKYAKLYGIWKTNFTYRREEGWTIDPNKGVCPLYKILNGEFPKYNVFRLKNKLIQSKIKKAECEQCGFNGKRVTDNEIPLIINFEDGNPENHRLENMKLLCYNCTFCYGKGYLKRRKSIHDLNKIQELDLDTQIES